MLKKLAEPEVTVKAPFANDVLNRSASIERLTNLVRSTEQPFVLSIEAPWGWGKTTFIRMWKAHLESKGNMCLLFNAWQNDFVDDPLVAFLGEIAKLIEKEKKELNDKKPVKEYLAEVKKIGAGILRKTLPLAIKIATHGLLDKESVKDALGVISEESDKVAEFASELAKERLERYESEVNGIEAFRQNLEKLTDAIVTEEGGASPLVFFIDEMDRCRPDFAIALLERIKHLFNVRRVVFVLAVDRAQLNESVKALYGLRANPDGYLRRFIDIAFSLPAPTTKRFIGNLYKRFTMDEIFLNIPNGVQFGEIWKTSFTYCANALNLSLRTQEQCFTQMNIALRMRAFDSEFLPAVLAFYCALRAYRASIFQDLLQNKISIETVNGWFSGVDNKWYKVWFEAALIHGFCTDHKDRRGRMEAMVARFNGPAVRDQFDPNRPGALAQDISPDGYRQTFLEILSSLEMNEQFH